MSYFIGCEILNSHLALMTEFLNPSGSIAGNPKVIC